jgi:hypothetical protein
MNTSGIKIETKVATTPRDRRGPGRRIEVSPALLPLLRRNERSLLPSLGIEIDVDEAADEAVVLQLRFSDGRWIFLACGIGVVMWAGLITAGVALYNALV